MTLSVDRPVLWQLRLSHFNEKARWALDHKDVAHERRTMLPAWHVARALRMTGKRTFPVLVLDGETIGDSAAIIAALEARDDSRPLYPADPEERRRALELEQHFGDKLGPDLRRVFFFHMLREEPQALLDAYTKPVGPVARRVYRATFPGTKAVMRQAMTINAEGAERSVERIHADLDRIEAELGAGDYLVGDSFTVADLTAAALLFPVVQPPQYEYDYPARIAPGLQDFRDSISSRRAFSWAREMWARHRGVSAAVA